jgi:hypothetical protein
LFSKQLPKERPSWDGKINMCTRWHIKGDCFDDCSRKESHVGKDKIPADKKANFLTYMSKCHKAAKGNLLLGSEPSGVRPPPKPLDARMPFGFDPMIRKAPEINKRSPSPQENDMASTLPPQRGTATISSRISKSMARLVSTNIASSKDSGGKSKSTGGKTISIDGGSHESDAR